MKWCALLGLLLFLGVAIVPSINADVKEPDIVEPELVEKKFENLVGLAEGVISYYERTYETSDCGCEIKETIPWKYPVICTVLYGIFIFFMTLFVMGMRLDIVYKLDNLGDKLNCYWSDMLP